MRSPIKIRIQAITGYKPIIRSGLFDQEFYQNETGIKNADIQHYVTIGWKDGYNPSAIFSTNDYLKAYPDVKQAGLNPLLHYFCYGAKEGRSHGVNTNDYTIRLPEWYCSSIGQSILFLKVKMSGLFDAEWYKKQYGISDNPFHHYIYEGYKKGYDPSASFHSSCYLEHYPQVKHADINPLLHYIAIGKKEGLFYGVEPVEKIRKSRYFDEKWYRDSYNIPSNVDAAEHYLTTGWKKWYNPSPAFSGLQYCLDRQHIFHCEKSANPLMHYELTYRKGVSPFSTEPIERGLSRETIQKYKDTQDQRITEQYSKNTKKLIVHLVPERDAVGGGVMSICSIAEITASIEEAKDYSVMVATVPSVNTFPQYTQFKSKFDVFRFDQIPTYFTDLEEIIFHIPEIFVLPFMVKMKPQHWVWIKNIPNVRVNILNQNMDYVPRPSIIASLKELIPDVTMTCAHKQYTSPQIRTSYDVPVHLFSASNMVEYQYMPLKKKKNLLLYSPDESGFKEAVLEKIKEEFPDLKMQEIRGLKYKDYLQLISQAKWMITFGEGIDGYFVESARCGAIPFAVQNSTFFSEAFDGLENIYTSYNHMLHQITTDIKRLSMDTDAFTALNDKIRAIDRLEYDDEAYIENIRKYYRGEYTLPLAPILKSRQERMDAMPLISICMATYNGERFLKEQLESIAALTYPNLELIVSDDGSKDDTLEILRNFHPRFPVRIVKNTKNHGVVANFTNAISYATGEYIAFADQDDVWKPNKFEILLERIDDFDIVHGGVHVIDKTGGYHPMAYMHAAYEVNKTMLYQPVHYFEENPILGCTTLMRADFVRNAMPIPHGIVYHDWWLAVKAVCSGRGACFLDIPVIQYRQHETNTAKTTFESKNFLKKKYTTLHTIEEKLGNTLNRYELEHLQTLVNVLCLKQFSHIYAPAYVNEYYDTNRGALTRESLRHMRAAIDEVLGEKK